MSEEILKKVYEAGSEYYDLDDYDTFKKNMQNPEIRKKVYTGLSEYYDLDDYTTFESKVGIEAPKKEKEFSDMEKLVVGQPVEGQRDIGLGEALKESLTEKGFLETSFPAQQVFGAMRIDPVIPQRALNVLTTGYHAFAGILPNRSGEFAGKDETLAQAIARKKSPSEALTEKEQLALGRGMRAQTGQYGETLPGLTKEETKQVDINTGKITADFVIDPWMIPGIRITRKTVGILSKTLKAIRAGEEAKALKILGEIPNVKPSQAEEYVNFWTAPENKAKLDQAEAVINRQQFEAQKIGKPEAEALKEQLARRDEVGRAVETGKRVFAEGAEKRKQAESVIGDIEKIPEELETQIGDAPTRVTKRARYEIGQEQAAREAEKLPKKKAKTEEPTPLETLTAKVKSGEASGKEIKTFVKESEPATVEKAETALREEFKAAKTPEEKVTISQGIDILTQEAGKKPKVPGAKGKEVLPEVTQKGNVDLRKPLPEGWVHVPESELYKENVYNYYDALESIPKSRRYEAIRGFEEKEGKMFATTEGKRFGKPTRYKPIEDGYVMRKEDADKLRIRIDILTQASGKKPQVPTKPTPKRGAPSGAQKVRTAIGRDPDLRLKDSEVEQIFGKGTEETEKLKKQIGGGKKTLDDVSRELQEAGTIEPAPKGYNSQHLIDKITEDAPTVAKAEQQAAKKADEVFGKTAKEAPKPTEKPVPPKPKGAKERRTYDELEVGDEFTINGEKFTVTGKEISPTGEAAGVKLKDSKRYEQNWGDFRRTVEFDEGSLKKAETTAKPEIVEPGQAGTAKQGVLKEGESIPLKRGKQEFAEQQAKQGRGISKLTRQQKKEKFAKKLEEGKYKGDMFVEEGKARQAEMPIEQLGKKKAKEPWEMTSKEAASKGKEVKRPSSAEPDLNTAEVAFGGTKEGALFRAIDNKELSNILDTGNIKSNSETAKRLNKAQHLDKTFMSDQGHIASSYIHNDGFVLELDKSAITGLRAEGAGELATKQSIPSSAIKRVIRVSKDESGVYAIDVTDEVLKDYPDLAKQAKPSAVEQVAKGKEPRKQTVSERLTEEFRSGKRYIPEKRTKPPEAPKRKLPDGSDIYEFIGGRKKGVIDQRHGNITEKNIDALIDEGVDEITVRIKGLKKDRIVAEKRLEDLGWQRWEKDLSVWVSPERASKIKTAPPPYKDLADYPKTITKKVREKPPEQLTTPKQTFRQFVESKGVKWDKVSGEGKDEALRQKLFDEYQGKTIGKLDENLFSISKQRNLKELIEEGRAGKLMDIVSKHEETKGFLEVKGFMKATTEKGNPIASYGRFNVRKALEKIAQNKSPLDSELAKKLLKHDLSKIEGHFFSPFTKPKEGSFHGGFYSRKTNEIGLNRDFIFDIDKIDHLSVSLLHETVHAVTSNALRVPAEKASAVVKTFQNDMSILFTEARNKVFTGGDFAIQYPLSNVDEFVTGVLTNAEFQRALSKIPYKNTTMTMWDKFVDNLRKLLNISKDDNLLIESVNRISRYVEGEATIPRKTLSGKDFATELLNAAKKDITSKASGITPDPYRNLKKFLDENKLKLTDAERKKLMDFASTTAKRTLLTAEKRQQLIDEYIAKNFQRTAEGIPTTAETPLERLTKPKAPKTEAPAKAEKPIDYTKVGRSKDKQFPEEIRKVLDEFRREQADAIEAQRRGVIPIEETQKAARILEPEMAKKLKEGIEAGTPMNAEQVTATARVVYKEIGNIIDDMVQGTENTLVSQMFGARSEIGRAMRALQVKPDDLQEFVNLAREKVGQIKDPFIRERVTRTLEKIGITKSEINPSRLEKFVEWATAIKLTGLSTQVKNIAGNMGELLIRIPEKAVGGAISKAKSAFMGVDRTVYGREAFAELQGIVGSARRAGRRFSEVLKNPELAFKEAKVSDVAVRGPRGAIGKGGRIGEKIDPIVRILSGGRFGFDFGEIVRSPFRVLGATDVFFKELNKGAEIYSLAARNALKEGNYGHRAIKEIAEEILKKPDEFSELHKIVDEKVLQRVFQERLEGIAAEVNTWRKKWPALRLVIPFYNTPANLLKRALRRVPGGTFLLPSDWRKFGYLGKLRGKPGLYSRNSPEFYEMLSQQIIGSMTLAGIGWMAMDGRLSGRGPRDRNRRDTMYATGWQPQSIKIGNTWVSYRGFEPFSSWFRTMGDGVENVKEGEKLESIGAGIATSFMKQYAENPFLTGVNDIFEAINDPEGPRVQNIVASLAVGSTVPVILQQWGTRVFDPTVREAKTLGEKVKSRLPFGPSKTLQPKRSIFGEEIVREYSAVPQAFGFTVSVQKNSKLDKELLRLKDSEGKPISIGKPSKNIAGVTLSEEEYDRYVQLAGMMHKEAIEKFVNSPAYSELNDDARIKTIRKIVRDNNAIVRHEQFGKYYQDSDTGTRRRRPSRQRRSRSRARQ